MPSDRPRIDVRRRLASAARLLRHRLWPLAVAVLAAGLTLPALGNGWIADDYFHRVILLGIPPFDELLGPPDEMFRFFRGDPARTHRLVDLGFLPWWTDPQIKAEFLQALTILTHRLDYRLWPDSPALMHAHSLGWFAALAGSAAVLYRRVLGRTATAGVAALLFAIDDAHATPVGWIANRNSLIAGTFGILALIVHDAWRRDGRRGGMTLALLMLAAALFSKEEGIAGCAYLLAYGLWLDPAGPRRGCLALLPYAGVVVAWRALRDSWGYGVARIGMYDDPLTDPASYAAGLAVRAPVLLLAQWGLPPADLSVLFGPRGWTILLVLAAAFLAWVAWTLAPLVRRDRAARFWATGMLLAVIPLCAARPMDRLLTAVGLGAFGVMAQFLAAVLGAEGRPGDDRWRRRARPLAWLLAAVHLVLAPLALALRAGNPLGPQGFEHRLYVRTPMGPEVRDQTVVIVNAPSAAHASFLPIRQAALGRPIPSHTRALASGMPAMTIRREDERTLAIRPEGGFLNLVLDRIYRSERYPLAVGDLVALSGMTAEVLALTADGRPAEARFRFAVPLEDDSLRWLCYREGNFVPFTLPAVGRTVELRVGSPWDLILGSEGHGRDRGR